MKRERGREGGKERGVEIGREGGREGDFTLPPSLFLPVARFAYLAEEAEHWLLLVKCSSRD